MKEKPGQYVLRDLWRFAWPRHSRTRILSEEVLNIQPIADRCGIHISEGWIHGGKEQALGIAGIQEWLDALDGSNGDLTLDSIYAATFLLNTRSLAWHAVIGDRIHMQEKQEVLDFLAQQVRIASSMLGDLNHLLLTDKKGPVCSVAECDEYIKEVKDYISSMMEIEKEVVNEIESQ